MILVLAGTKDGRLLTRNLAKAGYPVLASTVSLYGSLLLKEDGGEEVRFGPLDEEGLVNLIGEQGITMVIDATHPFATEVRQNGWVACNRLQIPWLRFEREGVSTDDLDNGTVINVDDMDGAIRVAASFSGNIFLTTGSSSVAVFAESLGPERLVVRLLPDPAALQQCAYLGISPNRLIAMQGPFSTELNKELFRHFKAAVVISKESGKTGGLPEKIAATAQLQIPMIIIGRPELPDGPVFTNDADLMDYVRRHFNKQTEP